MAGFAFGLVVLGLLLVGPASLGLAAVGQPLLLGKANNAAGKVTNLVAELADPALRVANKGPGPAIALDVGPGRPPLTVSKDAGKAANLNADELDGQDASAFVRRTTPTYEVTDETNLAAADQFGFAFAACDDGDTVLGGSFGSITANAEVVAAGAGSNADSWSLLIRRQATGGNASADVTAVCYDFLPLRGSSNR